MDGEISPQPGTISNSISTSHIASENTVSRDHPQLCPLDFDEYRFIQKIGSGAFGTVWRAHDGFLKRDVAIKVVRTSEFDDLAAIMKEALAVAKLQHPNIVRIYQVKHNSEHVFLISELIEGRDLLKLIRTKKPPCHQVAEICLKIAWALEHAHSNGIIHRDVKPSNILLNSENTPYLADFGIAKVMNTAATIRQPDEFIGSIGYMAPEQSQNKPVDARSDVYSLGVVLYELLTGSSPFTGTPQEVILGHQFQPPDSLRSRDKLIPIDLETICLKAIEKKPRERYQSARIMAEDLQSYLLEQAIRATPPSLTRILIRRLERSFRNPVILTSVIVLLLFLLSVFAFYPLKSEAIGYRSVKIKTVPPGCNIVAYPLDEMGDPDSKRSIEYMKATTPASLKLRPGKYRIVASNAEYPAAEVERYVPAIDENRPRRNLPAWFWSEDSKVANGIIWDSIYLKNAVPISQMIYIPGNENIPAFYLCSQESRIADHRLSGADLPEYFEDFEINENTPYWCNQRLAHLESERLGLRLPQIREIRRAFSYLSELEASEGITPPQKTLLLSLVDDIPEWTSSLKDVTPDGAVIAYAFRGDGKNVVEFAVKESWNSTTTPICFRGARSARRY